MRIIRSILGYFAVVFILELVFIVAIPLVLVLVPVIVLYHLLEEHAKEN